jgi:hypothetical protein
MPDGVMPVVMVAMMDGVVRRVCQRRVRTEEDRAKRQSECEERLVHFR